MEPGKKSYGAIVGSIIIIVILVLGGLYIWQTKVKQMQMEKAKALQQAQAIQAEYLKELKSLEQDINSTDTSTGVEASKIQ